MYGRLINKNMNKMFTNIMTIMLLLSLFSFSFAKDQVTTNTKLVAIKKVLCDKSDFLSIDYFCIDRQDTCKSSISLCKRVSCENVECYMYSQNMNLHAMMEEFNICLKKASEDFHLDSINEITIYLDNFGEMSIKISQQYDKIRPVKVKEIYYLGQFYHDVEKAIYMSGLKNQLNDLLKNYNVQIDTVKFDDDHFSFINKDDFQIKTKSSYKDLPPKIIQGFATCECKPMLRK